MNSFVKGVSIGTATGLTATAAYLATRALRVSLDRALARAEQVAREAEQALDRSRQALQHTEQAVHGIRETVAPAR
jgi:hypothetical protein